jgi:hypothetical protein
MKRRKFIKYSAAASTLIMVGGFPNFKSPRSAPIADRNSFSETCMKMRGGQCRDFRLMEFGPTAEFEKEIFGA